MPRGVMYVAIDLILDMCKGPGALARCWTVEQPLPKDARLIEARVVDVEDRLELVIESAELPERAPNEHLPQLRPIFRVTKTTEP